MEIIPPYLRIYQQILKDLEKLDGKVIKKHGREVVNKTNGLQVV